MLMEESQVVWDDEGQHVPVTRIILAGDNRPPGPHLRRAHITWYQ